MRETSRMIGWAFAFTLAFIDYRLMFGMLVFMIFFHIWYRWRYGKWMDYDDD